MRLIEIMRSDTHFINAILEYDILWEAISLKMIRSLLVG